MSIRTLHIAAGVLEGTTVLAQADASSDTAALWEVLKIT